MSILIAAGMAFSATTRAMDPALLQAVGGVLDVTRAPYNADNTGRRDATDAIRRAMHDASRRTPGIFTTADRAVQIVYLPDGVYRISDQLVFDTPEILAARPKPRDEVGLRYVTGHMMLVGQSRDGTILKAADGCPAFRRPGACVVRMTCVNGTNQGYWNSVVDLTIDAGHGNPGATALWFVSNNIGTIRGVRLLCRDDENPAELGLDLTAGGGGLGYIYDLDIRGFRTGIRAGDYHVGYTLENVRLQGQHELGIDNTNKNLFIRHLASDNRVPILHNRTSQGQVVLLDSDLRGGAAGSTAILNNAAPMFLRNVCAEGYGRILPDRDGKEIGECVVGKIFTLWPEAPRQSLGLEVKETPEVPWGRPEAWRIFDPSLQDDDTAALQAAIDSGAETVVIKSDVGRVRLTDTVHLRGNLRRLHGGWCNLDVTFSGEPRPLFQIETGTHPVMVVEALSNGQRVHGFDTIVNDSDKTVVLKDLFLDYGRSNYRNHGRGDLFIESVVSGGGDFDHLGMRPTAGWLVRGQRVWARNLNPEAYAPDLQVEGGSFWCLGAKLGEIYGPYLEAGGGARVEMLGAVLNTCPPSLWKPDRKGYAIRSVDSEVCFVGVDRIRPGAGEGPNPVQIVEERGSERRELLHRDLPRRILDPSPADPLSVAIPLYRSAVPQATGAATQAAGGGVRNSSQGPLSFRPGM